VSQAITQGLGSTLALKGSTEEEQFHGDAGKSCSQPADAKREAA
jgi:hypothetical protein